MSPQQTEPTTKSSRGSRRRPRKSTNSTSAHSSSVRDKADIPEDPGSLQGFEQPMRILRRKDNDITPDVNITGNLELPNPTTPPATPSRVRSMYDGFPDAQYQGHQSAPDLNPQRKKGRKSHGVITRASGAVRSEPNEAPMSTPPQQLPTPSRPKETPVKAYAGPTFHASPAPSSLPIPKFLSRSVPNVDKTLSLKDMMEQEGVDTTSESDSPPFLEKGQPKEQRQAREESPLDIFFQADRDAKAKAKGQGVNPVVLSRTNSESQNRSRHHSRQPTSSSLSGIFPIEMDGAAVENPHDNADSEPITPTRKVVTETDYRDELRKAQTIELKKLLYSPKPQRSVSSSPCSSTPFKGLGSPSPKLTSQGGSPVVAPDSASKDQQRQAILLALAQRQISGTSANIGSTPQRPPSSKLREEMSVPISPGARPPELPATPTQSRAQSSCTLANSYTKQQQNSYASPYSPLPSAFTPPAKPPGGYLDSRSRHSRDAKSIEEDLRRILKLDVLGGDDMTDVRS